AIAAAAGFLTLMHGDIESRRRRMSSRRSRVPATRRGECTMDRRDFLKKSSAGALGLTLSRPGSAFARNRSGGPNILFIVVDEMRFPSVFPTGVKSAAEFL